MKNSELPALGSICVLLLGGVLYAGLNPFHAPRNKVSWLEHRDGLRFTQPGTVLSADSFSEPGLRGGSLEVWIEARYASANGGIVGFYNPNQPSNFLLAQSITNLELQNAPSSAWRRTRTSHIYEVNQLRPGEVALWTITLGPEGTSVYRDGAAVMRTARFRIAPGAFSGRLVLGATPLFNSPWSGIVRGLAIYDRALPAARVASHFRTWATGNKPELDAEDDCVALYLMNERAGSTVHNRAGRGHELFIPERYELLNQTVLDPVWRAFRWSRSFWNDALINVAGFIPVGFFFCAYLFARGWARPALAAVLLGAGLSLFIELLQTQLPTRDSSMSDVITNILGSIIGAVLYRWLALRADPAN